MVPARSKPRPTATRPAQARRAALLRLPGKRPSLLAITAGIAGLSAIAHALGVAAPAVEAPTASRLGTSIQQSLSERDAALAKRQRALEFRERAVRAAEQRMAADQRARLGDAGQPGAPVVSKSLDQSYDELARIYQTMKPAKAAQIFERLDLEVQTQIARRMRERSTALILSNMSPSSGVQLSMSLVGKPVPKAPLAAPERAGAPLPDPAARPAAGGRPTPAGDAVAPAR